jgi:hypothetical protein
VIVGDDVRLEVSFNVAQARLVNLARGSSLASASGQSYDEGITHLTRVGPLGPAPGISKLVEVRYRDLVTHGDSAVLTLRWEVTGHGSGVFPALDADITLTRAGEDATVLSVAGAYRPPLGSVGAGLDRAIMHRAATATISSFINRIAEAIVHPDQAPAHSRDIGAAGAAWMPSTTQVP